MYRHPSSNLFNFEEKSAKSLKTIKARQKYVIFGDFNVDCNKSSSVPSIANYINHINRLGCTQSIDKPTRITHQSQIAIDHIYINSTMIKEIYFYLFQTTGSIVTKSYQKESRKIYIHKTDTVTFSHLLYRPYRDNDYNNQSGKTHHKSSTQILTYSQNESTEKQMKTRIF